MTDPQIALMMLGLFIAFVFLGFPIAFTLMAMGIGFGYYAYFDARRMWRSFDRLDEGAGQWEQWSTWFEGLFNNRIFDLFVNQTYTVMANEVLTAVPLFAISWNARTSLTGSSRRSTSLPRTYPGQWASPP